MIRARFYVNDNDYRPVNWPIKHPYWRIGYGEGYAVIVAYADDEAEILANWPDAVEIESVGRSEYTFTSRFPKPQWFELPEKSILYGGKGVAIVSISPPECEPAPAASGEE